MCWRLNLEFKNDLDILDKLRIKKLSWHIGQMAWIIRRHLDKASGSMSSQTNLLKENPSRAFKNKDATQGSGKLWATKCWKLRGYVQEVLPSTGPGPLFFPRLLLLANARGRWADAALHMAALMSCSWAQSKKGQTQDRELGSSSTEKDLRYWWIQSWTKILCLSCFRKSPHHSGIYK